MNKLTFSLKLFTKATVNNIPKTLNSLKHKKENTIYTGKTEDVANLPKKYVMTIMTKMSISFRNLFLQISQNSIGVAYKTYIN